MDDILNTLDDRALNELTAEPRPPAPQPARPASQPPPQSVTSSPPRPLGRVDYQTGVRRPMAQPMASPQPMGQPTVPAPIPARPEANLAQPAAPPARAPMPGFQSPQPAAVVPQVPKVAQSGTIPVGVSASSLGLNVKTQPKLPIGIYIIGGLAALDLVISFLSANTSALYSLAMVVELLVVVGLFTKVDLARQAAVVFQVINVVLVILVIIGLMATEAKINQLSVQYNDAVTKASAHASPQQEVAIDNFNTQINLQRKQVGKAIGIDYMRSSLAILISGGIIWYLTRPGVKAAFH